MSLSAVFKYMAKQAVDCRNMVRVKVWHTHTTVRLLKNYSQRISTYNTIILLLDLTCDRTMDVGRQYRSPGLYVAVHGHVHLVEPERQPVSSSELIFIQALQQLKHSRTRSTMTICSPPPTPTALHLHLLSHLIDRHSYDVGLPRVVYDPAKRSCMLRSLYTIFPRIESFGLY